MRAQEHKDRCAAAVLSCMFNILTSSMNTAKISPIYNYGSMGCYGNALGKRILKQHEVKQSSLSLLSVAQLTTALTSQIIAFQWEFRGCVNEQGTWLVLLWKAREQNVQGVCWVLLLLFKACNPLLTCSRLKHLICTNQQLPHKSLLVHETGGLGHSLAPRPVHISDLGTSRASPVVSSSSLIANNLQSPAKNISIIAAEDQNTTT